MSSHHDFHNSIYIYEIEMKRYTDIAKKERDTQRGRGRRGKGEGRGERGEGEGVYSVVSSNGGITSYGWL